MIYYRKDGLLYADVEGSAFCLDTHETVPLDQVRRHRVEPLLTSAQEYDLRAELHKRCVEHITAWSLLKYDASHL